MVGQALRAHGLSDDDLHRTDVGAVKPVGTVHRVLEGPRRTADLADADLDVELVVEPQRRVVAHVRLADREVDALRDQIALVLDAELPEVRDATDLRVQEVVRVVDDLLGVRLPEAHTLAECEWERRGCDRRLHARQVTGLARSLLDLRAWLYDTMTTRPKSLSESTESSMCTTVPRTRRRTRPPT